MSAAPDISHEHMTWTAGFRDSLLALQPRPDDFDLQDLYLQGYNEGARWRHQVTVFHGRVFNCRSIGRAGLAWCEIRDDSAMYGEVQTGGVTVRWCDLGLFVDAGGWPT